MVDNLNDELWDDPINEEPAYEPTEPTSVYNPDDDSIYDDGNDDNPDHDNDPNPNNSPKNDDLPKDYLSRLLRSKKIDRDHVRIQNDKGEIEEWKFDDLDDDTKYGILSDYELPISDDEIEDLNYLRENKMSLAEFAEYQKKEAIRQYLEQNSTPSYTVDSLSDDDLYKFDLKDQMPDLTDEEVNEQLEKAKENETFFNKKIAALRKEYKELEDNEKQAAEEEAARKEEEDFNNLAQSLVAAARATDEMNGMELEDTDKEEVLDFLLNRDANGQSEFYKLFSDPNALFKMAWFALKGDEAYNALTDYYKGEIAKARRAVKPVEKPIRTVRRPAKPASKEDDPYGLNSVFN